MKLVETMESKDRIERNDGTVGMIIDVYKQRGYFRYKTALKGDGICTGAIRAYKWSEEGQKWVQK